MELEDALKQIGVLEAKTSSLESDLKEREARIQKLTADIIDLQKRVSELVDLNQKLSTVKIEDGSKTKELDKKMYDYLN